MFLYQEEQVWAIRILSILFFRQTRTFNFYSGRPEKVKVLKTKNTALGIQTTRGNDIPKLSDKIRCTLRLMYCELEVVIIDEICGI